MRVTVVRKHPLSGYYGIIHRALGWNEDHFSIELEAKNINVNIEKKI